MRTRQRRRPSIAMTCAIASALCAVACEPAPRPLEWGVRFASDGDRARAAFVRAQIRREGCDGEIVFEDEIAIAAGVGSATPARLSAGTYAITARARDGSCVWFADGCLEIELPRDEAAVVVLARTTDQAACEAERCTAGTCDAPDGGVVDAGDGDGDGGTDGGADAGSDGGQDAGPPCTPGGDECGALECCDDACRDLQSDRVHCGACGRACGPGQACAGGVCVCEARFLDCDASPANGCEVDGSSSVLHCGACGMLCARANAAASCTDGVCGIAACSPGFDDCDGVDGNGCESTNETLAHCGACGTSCSRANATATCAGGTCRIESCNPGFADCDGLDASGCETSIRTVTSCGACGVSCVRPNANETCATGSCAIASCTPGYGNCDGNAANGCETDLDTSEMHCGGCGDVCGALGDQCSDGVCVCGFMEQVCDPARADRCALSGCRCGGSSMCPVGQTCFDRNCI